MKIRSIYPAFVAVLSLGHCFAFEDSPFSQYKEVEVGDAGEGIVSVRLDDAIFKSTKENYADLLVVNVSGEEASEVPWDLERITREERPRRRDLSTTVESLVESEENRIELTVKLNQTETFPNRLSINTPLQDFERRVQVLGSDDGSNWEELVAGELIFDYSRFLDFRRTTIQLPPNEHEYLKVVIDGAVEKLTSPLREITKTVEEGTVKEKEISLTFSKRPFRMDRITFSFDPEPEEEEHSAAERYSIAGFDVSEDEENKQTVIMMRSLRQPLTHFSLETSSRNFRRAVHLQIPTNSENLDTTTWRTVTGGSVLRYDIGSIDEERLTLECTEQREAVYRIVIENKDNPPLAITGVTTSGPAYEMRFLSESARDYRLYYGGTQEDLKRPDYDVSALRVAKEKKVAAVIFPVGPEISNPNFDNSVPVENRGILENQWFLRGAIALVVFVLIAVLFRAAKRIEEVPAE